MIKLIIIVLIILLIGNVPQFDATELSSNQINYKGRRWYISGQFSSLKQSDGSILENVNNVASFNGTHWEAMGNGTDGVIHDIKIDSCLNVYVVGEFTRIGNIEVSAPAAKWSPFTQEWKAIDNTTGSITYTNNRIRWKNGFRRVINSVTVDCWNIPGTILNCNCDVYLGGSFVIEFIDQPTQLDGTFKNATNIVRWDDFRLTWDRLGGPEASGIIDVEKPVRSVYKKDSSITLVEKSVWVAGDFDGYIKKRMLRDSDDRWITLPSINGPVYKIDYRPLPIGYDLIFFSGNFNFSYEGVHCKYICVYQNHQSLSNYQSLGNVSSPYAPPKPVTSFSLEDDLSIVYMASDTANYSISKDNEFVEPPVAPIENGLTSIKSVHLCNVVELSCSSGSLTLLGRNNYLRFYDSNSETWHAFGDANPTDGNITLIDTIYFGDSSASTLSVHRSIMMLFVVCWMFL
mmetsp:Transcript_6184/g.8994  ORF Transcript_6184/g.8994 Transcript_6184/m.8994 type:complete len:459 (+) Transcript_6184:55-1431(+)